MIGQGLPEAGRWALEPLAGPALEPLTGPSLRALWAPKLRQDTKTSGTKASRIWAGGFLRSVLWYCRLLFLRCVLRRAYTLHRRVARRAYTLYRRILRRAYTLLRRAYTLHLLRRAYTLHPMAPTTSRRDLRRAYTLHLGRDRQYLNKKNRRRALEPFGLVELLGQVQKRGKALGGRRSA